MSAMQLRQLNPTSLLIDVNLLRTDAALDRDFLASVADCGVLVPIVAVRTAGSSQESIRERIRKTA